MLAVATLVQARQAHPPLRFQRVEVLPQVSVKNRHILNMQFGVVLTASPVVVGLRGLQGVEGLTNDNLEGELDIFV